MRYGLGEESEEELGTKEDSLLLTGERGGGQGVPGLHPVQGGGIGMAIDREGGAKVSGPLYPKLSMCLRAPG